MKDRLTTAPLPLDRPQCSCGTLNARSAIGTRLGASGTARRGLVKKPLLHTRYTRNRGGNVEQSWCFRGERLRHCDSSAECDCKFTTFF